MAIRFFLSGIRHDLWVKTEFDSDGNGKLDRMHVDVTRQKQTDTDGLKVPVLYQSSPYYADTGTNDAEDFWSLRQEVGAQPVAATVPVAVRRLGVQPRSARELIETR